MPAVGELGAILGIWAHPDDETYLAGGVMAAAAERGQPVACVTATAGERGTDDPVRWPPQRLAALRARELARALRVLGVGRHVWLGYPDGSCAEVAVDDAVARLAGIIQRLRPDTILTFGPDGLTGHPDHVAVGRWAERAAAGVTPRPQVLHAAKDAGWVARFADLHRHADVFWPGYPIPVPVEQLAVCLDLPERLLDRKVAALRAQASQTDPLVAVFGAQRWRQWIATEAFADLSGSMPATAAATSAPQARGKPDPPPSSVPEPPQAHRQTPEPKETTMSTTPPTTPDEPATQPPTAQPDPATLEAFVDGVLDDIKGHQVALMVALGDHLGLFTALAQGPATSAELARRTGLRQRYVTEWLAGMTAAGYLTYDPAATVFWLTPEQAAVLADDTSPVGLAGLFHEMSGAWAVFDEVKQAFRVGGGVTLDRYPDSWWDGMERFTGTWFDNLLLPEWVPAAEGIAAKLAGGARVADVGCGRGRALIKLAQAYPEVTAVGYDLSAAQLAGARRNAEQAGVADRVRFEQRDAASGLDARFDVVTCFDVAHDLVDPDAVLRAIRQALEPGGSLLLLDFKVADRLEDNVGRIPAMFYGFSLTYCLTTSLAHDGEALGTCGLPESEVRARCERAGFARVDVVPFDDPFNVLYQAKV